MDAPRLVLLCHSGGWDRLFQASGAAAAAATLGRDVVLVFFFGALERLAAQDLDEVRLEPRDEVREATLRERAQGVQPVSKLLGTARAAGARVFACSASAALAGTDPEGLAEHVDEVVGWPTILRLMDGAQVLYL